MTSEGTFKPTGAKQLLSFIRAKDISIPAFCEKTGLDRIKTQKAIRGELQRIDVDFAFDVERVTDGAVQAEAWCAPDEIREARRKHRSEVRSEVIRKSLEKERAESGSDPEAA